MEAHRRAASMVEAASRDLTLGDFAEALERMIERPNGEVDHKSSRAFAASRAIADASGRPARGMWIPLVAGRSLNSTTNTGQGGYLVNLNAHDGRLVEALKPYSGVIASGARIVSGLADGALVMPKVEQGIGLEWIGEGGTPSSDDPQFDQVIVQPRTLSATITFSRQVSRGSSTRGGLVAALSGELQAAMWSEVDRVILAGSGADDEPEGLIYREDVPTVSAGTNGNAPTWSLLTEMEEAVGVASGNVPTAWFANSAGRRKLRLTEKANGSGRFLLEGADLFGIPFRATEHLPGDLAKGEGSNLSPLLLGDWSQVVVGLWGPPALDVIVDPYTLANFGQVRMTAFLEVGYVLRHADALVRCTDLVTTVG